MPPVSPIEPPPGAHRSKRMRGLAALAATTAALLVGALLTVVLPSAANAAAGAGTYSISNAGSGLCLDDPGSTTVNDTQLDLQSCSGAANQTWTLATASTGFTITSHASNLCVGIKGASTGAGEAVQQQTCSGATDQEWTLTAGTTTYQLVNVNSSKCMNASENGTTAGTLVVQNSCDSTVTKSWTLTSGSGTTPTATASATATHSASSSPSSSPSTSPGNTKIATGDPRSVGQPSVPAVCSTLTATLATSNEQFSSSEEASPPDTSRIQSALNSCKGTNEAVELTGSGSDNAFLSAPLTVPAGVYLVVNYTATLYATTVASQYQSSSSDVCGTIGSSDNGCNPFIKVDGANSGIEGVRSSSGAQGTIDGRGDQDMYGTSTTWYSLATTAGNESEKQNNPRLIVFDGANSAVLYDINLVNAAFFHVTYESGSGFTAWGVRIKTPATARNTDGIDPDAASDITIENSYIQDGDDGIAIKGGSGESDNITIENNHFYGTHGISVGGHLRYA